MKRYYSRLLSLLTALVMLLSCVPALAEAPAQDPVLVTFDGEDIPQSAIQAMLNQLVDGGYANDGAFDLAVEYYVQDRVMNEKIAELGLDQFTAEEEEAIRAEADATWEEAIASYVSYFLTDDTEEAREQARQDAVAYYASYGYDQDVLFNDMKRSAEYDKLETYLLDGREVTVTEEEIQAEYDAAAANQQESVQDNVYMYELYQHYYGTEFFYIPEGYRGIIHILMKIEDDLLSAYQDAQTAFEESVTEEAPEGDEALKAARDAAFDAAIASKQAEINEIYARLENGEDFKTLIAEFGEDPGMNDAANLNEGYAVHKDSVVWDPVFTAAAFSEKMNQPGDTADPVIGSYGIHILHYLRDIPAGKIDMTDAIHAEIEQALHTEKLNSIYAEAVETWSAQHEIVYHQEAIDALMNPVSDAPAEDAAE